MIFGALYMISQVAQGFKAKPQTSLDGKCALKPTRLYTINPLPESNEPMFQTRHARYPPYPYVDAPPNLFFEVDEDSSGQSQACSQTQSEYMKNATARQNGNNVDPKDTGLLDELHETFPADFDDYVFSTNTAGEKEEIVTDFAEYDILHPGLGPWPNLELLKSQRRDLNTSLFIHFDPQTDYGKCMQGPPMFTKEIKTIGEARTEQRRWLDRNWGLTYDEIANLPRQIREAYYANRYNEADENERFLNVLHYRRSLGKAGSYLHPLEFRYMEDSYTFSPKKSPVARDLRNWDDPLDAPWRLRANEAIWDATAFDWPAERIRVNTGIGIYDITWLPAIVKVVVERSRDEGDAISVTELRLLLLKLEKRLEQLDDEEFTQVYKNHIVVVATKPTDSSRLICRRDWNENVGKEIQIDVYNDEVFRGILLGSNSTFGLKVEIEKEVKILPISLLKKIRLVENMQSRE
ncbi:hypothetical protein BdWA1_001448 [Babesia duncani]|uniref:Uncharacterized protein n=1 Tax=Babesia duncani TaxID=323732 RepID=A0AAD9PPN5_9APIC|nr:hypothetical protein BdWA1_001448 [Babesia duncani]